MQTCPSCREENPERFRLCGYCGAPLAPALMPQEVRKTVTIVFSDLKGSTNLGEALDSESLREVMTRYFAAMSVEIERHGGTIEKYIGDAIMAVFGLPTVHEDDALRAVRAVAGMQRALAGLNDELESRWGVRLTNRTGVNTGEVVAGDPTSGQRLVTGDAVNTAARLEQAAPADEALLGELTYRLVRDAVEVEPVEPLELKGKAERVPAYRLLEVHSAALEGQARREETPLVGRETEIARLSQSLSEAVMAGGVRLVTVIGEAGVGKSRLIRGFLESVEGQVEVVRGRCLSYGEGITFWPLLEIVREAAAIDSDDSVDLARSKLLGLVSDRDVAARVAAIAGLSPAQFPLLELYWGGRRLLELLAARRPVVAVFDDIHWAEPAFLDFIEHVLVTGQAPILIVCTARDDLQERSPEFGTGVAADRLTLAPLDDEAVLQVAANLVGQTDLPGDVIARILTAAEGNPLFLEHLLAMLIDSGTLRFDDGRWVRADELAEIPIPPTIHALLAARLDQLGREERVVIEPAAVIGSEFPAPAVAALAPEIVREQVPAYLDGIARKHLVRPLEDPSRDVTHRFQHLLVRDAAYAGLLKRNRATLHEQFVTWADGVNAQRGRGAEFEEILGYHLEQAHRYLAELGPLDDRGVALGIDGATRLSSAARRAFVRGDMHAAAGLYRRAIALLVEHDPNRLEVLPELGEALMELGEFDEATAVLDDAKRLADARFDERLAAHASLLKLLVEVYTGEAGDWADRVRAETAGAITVFEREGDNLGLARAWRLRVGLYVDACLWGKAAQAADLVIEFARRASDPRLETRGVAGFVNAALYGPMSVADALEKCEKLLDEVESDRRTVGLILGVLAELNAMAGDFDAARRLYTQSRITLEQLGRSVLASATSTNSWRVEVLAGDLGRAEDELRRDYAALEQMREQYLLSWIAGGLAEVLYRQHRDQEAESFTRVAERYAGEGDVYSGVLWRCVRAKLLARGGDAVAAEHLIGEAFALTSDTDAPEMHANILMDLAECHRSVGRVDEALPLIRAAITLYESKGHVAAANRAQESLLELGAGAA